MNGSTGTAGLWTGCAGDGQWTTADNWDNRVVPTATDNVVININETVTISGAAFAKSIYLSNGGDLTVSASNTLTVSTAANPASAIAIRVNPGCVLTNDGTIAISNSASEGIQNQGTVTNTSDITITDAGYYGFFNSSNDIFNNSGTVTISNSTSDGIKNNGTVTNAATGDITITDAGGFGFYNPSIGIFNNLGTVTILNSTSDGIQNDGTVTNAATGDITITDAGRIGFYNSSNDIFNNSGTVTISNSTSDGIKNYGTVTNAAIGDITITGGTKGFYNYASGDILTNAGILTISGATGDELYNTGGTVTNTNGTLEINGSISGIPSLAGTLAPGNSIGQTDNNGSLTLTGTLQIEADDPTTFDVLNSTNVGTLDLTAATLDFVFPGVATDYTNGDKFQIITNFATVTAVGTITNNLGFTMVDNSNGEFEITLGGLLPVELVSFKGEAMDRTNLLKWETASEENTQYHIIQRSADGNAHWEEIGRVEAAGNSTLTNQYSLEDTQPLVFGYYQLISLDFDGYMDYSDIISIKREVKEDQVQLFPNPVTKNLTVEIGVGVSSNYDITIVNMIGQVVSYDKHDFNEGNQRIEMEVDHLVNGVYHLVVESKTGKQVKRFVKQ